MIRLSPARTVAAVALVGATGFYMGAVARNTTPSARDEVRFTRTTQTAASTTTSTLAPGTISWTNTPDGKCHEDMSCFCETHVCLPQYEDPTRHTAAECALGDEPEGC